MRCLHGDVVKQRGRTALEHTFDGAGSKRRFAGAISPADRGSAGGAILRLAERKGARVSSVRERLGRFDEAWQALEQEVADHEHPFGRAFQHFGRTLWYAGAGDFERVIRDVPCALTDAKELQRAWIIPWAENLLTSAIVARAPGGTSEATLRASAEAAGGRLREMSLVEAYLVAGNAEAALDECERQLPQLGQEGKARAYWMLEELRIQALLALGRFNDVCSAVETALATVTPLGWRSLAWRLQASKATALTRLGDQRAAAARRAAVELLTAVAGTLRDTTVRGRFLSQPVAARLLE